MSLPQSSNRLVIPPEIEAEMTPAVKAFVEALIDHYEARISELDSQVKRLTPQNSSLPPSTQHPHAKPKRAKRDGEKKKRGGQTGHKKHQRELIPPEECDDVVPLLPDSCRRCGKPLAGKDSEPIRHQIWELPVIKPIVTEFQQHRLFCPCCGITTCASLPEGVPRGQSGPRLVAFTALLMGHFRQSKRRASLFLQDLLKMPCCPSLTVKMQNQASAAIKVPYEQLKDELGTQGQLFMDESPTKQANKKAWLWTAVAPLFAVFAIFSSRKGDALPKLLGASFSGIINCDRAKMYWQAKRLQWCWAHLKRDIQALIDHPDKQVQRLGHDLMRQVKLMFQHWRRYKAGKTSWETFRRHMSPVRKEINALLLRGAFSGNKRLIGMCNELYKHRDWLWTFVDVKGIEPTNNTAERALRPAVIYRKLSFGTQSESGSRFIERMLTVSETCRLQNRSPYEYLIEAVTAYFSNKTPPSLLPNP
jgi:transposase